MFSALELGAFFVETALMDSPVPYREPDVVRLVFGPDPFAKLGVRLDEPPVVLVSLNLLDARTPLTHHVLLNVLLEGCRLFEDLLGPCVFTRPDGKQSHDLGTRFL
jgi:hypothetical protein